jgi:polysaccharide export outer membrane protein
MLVNVTKVLPLVAALAFCNVGCQSALKSTPNALHVFKPATEHDVAVNDYVVDPPDEIEIAATSVKEIDKVKQVVRADGQITLNLLGDVKVSGKTPKQIEQMLTKIADKYYTHPDIKVHVVCNSKFFTIFGRGANNGRKVAYTGNDNIVRALAEAGTNEHFWPQQVLLVRPAKGPGEQPARAVINFLKMQETGDMTQNYALREGDIITLRGSPLDIFNFKMTQLLAPISGATEAGSGMRNAAQPGGGYGY